MLRVINFLKQDEGAVTVDWVVLTAAIVALIIATISVFASAAVDPAEGISAKLIAIAEGEGGI